MIGRHDIVRRHRRTVVELYVLTEREGNGLAVVGRFPIIANVALEIARRLRVIRINADQQAVKRTDRMDHSESRFAVAVVGRNLTAYDNIQDTTSLHRHGRRGRNES